MCVCERELKKEHTHDFVHTYILWPCMWPEEDIHCTHRCHFTISDCAAKQSRRDRVCVCTCVCVCVCVPAWSMYKPSSKWWPGVNGTYSVYKPANGAMAYHGRISMGSSPGHCSIASLGWSLACAPVEKLRNSQELQIVHRMKVKKRQQSVWFFATWNVRSLVDIKGSVETARQSTETHQAEDRRIDQVIRELKRYQVSVAALQETKWSGNALYHIDDCVVLAGA